MPTEMIRLSAFRTRLRNRRSLYLLNHYLRRWLQTNWYRLEALRWRLRWKGEPARSEEEVRQSLRERTRGVLSRAKGALNILYVGFGNRVSDESGVGGVVDRYASANMLPALRQFGRVHEFVVEYPSDGLRASWRSRRRRANEDLLKLFGSMGEKPDVLIGQMSGWMVEPPTISEIRAKSVVVINYSWDDTAGFYGGKVGGDWIGPAALASAVDLTLTSSRGSCLKYQAEGGLALFWPEAGNPEIHRPYDVPFEYDVSFVGGRYGYRPLLIDFLRKHGIRVVAFGPGWEDGLLSPEEMVRLFSRSRINLGFGGIGHMVKVSHLKGRDFEIPMSGGLHLTSYNPELEECYDIGREIVCYKDRWDCLAKIRDLLHHPDKADAIRKAGRERALRDHTWERRLEEAFQRVGLLKRRS